MNTDEKMIKAGSEIMSERMDLIEALFENDSEKAKIDSITEIIIGCAYQVANELGCGFLEKVYENALAYEIRKKSKSFTIR